MIVKPNIPCTLYASTGYDMYGAPQYSSGTPLKCLIVKLITISDREIVRVDAGASRGNGRERKEEAVLLFDSKVVLNQGDRVKVVNLDLQVKNIHPRFSIQGKHDHNEVELMIWQS